jgi:mono/diheme cytochrome c family protein
MASRFLLFMILAAGTFARAASAGEDNIQLKEGPGREIVETRCVACHSLDYIEMNSPILDRKGWEASVGKMVRIMGARIDEAEVQTIVDYLTTQYGK